jgi:hypothetical protein
MEKSKLQRSIFRTLELTLITMIAVDAYHSACFWAVWGLCLLFDIYIDLKEKEAK